jgi:hypothetical protein
MVRVTIPGLLRIIALRFMLRSARDTLCLIVLRWPAGSLLGGVKRRRAVLLEVA